MPLPYHRSTPKDFGDWPYGANGKMSPRLSTSLPYHRSTPDQFGDWLYGTNGEMSPRPDSTSAPSPNPSICSKELPQLNLWSPFPTSDTQASSKAMLPSPADKGNRLSSSKKRDDDVSPPVSLRSLILVESNKANLRHSGSYRSSSFESGRLSVDSTSPASNLFRLSALDALRRDAFLEAESNYGSSFLSPAQRTMQSTASATSIADEGPWTPQSNAGLLIPFPTSSPSSPSSPLTNFFDMHSDDEKKDAQNLHVSKGGIFKAIFRRRTGSQGNKTPSPPCPPGSFLDMDEGEELTALQKTRSQLARLIPFSHSNDHSQAGTHQRVVGQADSNPSASTSTQDTLLRTMSKHATSTSPSSMSLDLKSWGKTSDAKNRKNTRGFVSRPPLPKAWRQKKSAQEKRKINIKSINVSRGESANSNVIAAPNPDNALGIEWGYEESMALAKHLREHVFRTPSPPPHSTMLWHLDSSSSSGLNFASGSPLLLRTPDTNRTSSSKASFTTCDDADSNGHTSPAASSSGSRLTKAELYARYSPAPTSSLPWLAPSSPILRDEPRLPSNPVNSTLTLKEIRSSSVGSGRSYTPEPCSAVICNGSEAHFPISFSSSPSHENTRQTEQGQTRQSLRKSKTSSSIRTIRSSRSFGPPPCPPPTCALPPLPTRSSSSSAVSSSSV